MGRAAYVSSMKKRQDETLKEQKKMPLALKIQQSSSDSKDEMRVGYAVTPKVCYDRVKTVRGFVSDESVVSTMTQMELQEVAERYPWPRGVVLQLPCIDGGDLDRYWGYMVVHREALHAGLRLPMHPIIRDFLFFTKLRPAQLSPNSWRFLLAFLLKFKELDLVPSYDALKPFFSIKPGSILEFPSINLISNTYCPANWRSKWFLVYATGSYISDFPIYSGDSSRGSYRKITAKKDHKEEYKVNEFRKSLAGSKPCYTDVFGARQLEEAGLSLPYPVKVQKPITKRIREVNSTSSLEKKKGLTKSAKRFCSPQKNLASTKPLNKPILKCSVHSTPIGQEEEPEAQEEEDPEEEEEEEEEDDPGEEENGCIPQEKEEIVAEEEPKPASARPFEQASTSRVHGKKDASQKGGIDAPSNGGECPSSPPGFGARNFNDPGISGCSREMSRSVRLKRLLPEIVQAAEDLEKMEQQLNESIQENLELKREKAELQSRMERMEIDKKAVEEKLIETQSKLMQTAQKAKELFEMSSPSGAKH